ncbi:unnamed protein product [Aspergillus oryzae]|uniref:Unnamed protein product n=2 Tax=Aspergillus oryzae TaxID=5062 RepID=A0AAN5BZD0_ASPOZ|nr:unnamed protein product [Aspergillus oryzae]GMF88629.1 unnamed protein product [Aspergillus oryzae]GMG06784.1 unnamed protein product [Aspergillus oryzae]GMG31386.1 unnamed protein product [Aspergillus oryzae]GMG52395.1 unnamed protein product [Aspergillus oryzae var. brunneus]
MPPYITTHQFIDSRSTVEVKGKKANTNTGTKKHKAPMLMAIPNRPRLHRRGGRGSPRIRLSSTHPIVITYEDISDPIVKVTIAKRAVVEPMLINDRRTVTIRETITALSGMFHPGVTYIDQHRWPEAATRGGDSTYVSKKPGKWKTAISGKRPKLPRGRGQFRDCTRGERKNQDRGHGVRAGKTIGGIIEHLNKWVAGGGCEDLVDITQGEADRHQHEKSRAVIDQNGSDHSLWEGL